MLFPAAQGCCNTLIIARPSPRPIVSFAGITLRPVDLFHGNHLSKTYPADDLMIGEGQRDDQTGSAHQSFRIKFFPGNCRTSPFISISSKAARMRACGTETSPKMESMNMGWSTRKASNTAL